MFIDLKPRLDRPEIAELLEDAAVADISGISGEELANQYGKDARLELWGLEEEDEVVGLVGFEQEAEGLSLKHIAVVPEARGKGYGRGLLLELLHQRNPERIVTEADEEGVHFYRRIGFQIESLGIARSGAERFKCTYESAETVAGIDG